MRTLDEIAVTSSQRKIIDDILYTKMIATVQAMVLLYFIIVALLY